MAISSTAEPVGASGKTVSSGLSPAKRPRLLIPANVRTEVWDKSDGSCAYCGRTLHPFSNFHIDHVIPISKGGSDDPANLVASCQQCNVAKRDRSVDEFQAQQAAKVAAAAERRLRAEALGAMPDDSEYMTLGEAQEALGVSNFTIWQLVKNGKLQTFMQETDRRKKLVRRVDVEALKAVRPMPPKEPQ